MSSKRPLEGAEPTDGRLEGLLRRQRRAFRAEGAPDQATRVDRLDRAIEMVSAHEEAIIAAVTADFGARPAAVTRLADVATSIGALRYARRHLKRWMARQRRRVEGPMLLMGAKAWIDFQPLGVVGIMSPWNYPITLSLVPLADALAAGNRAMLKPSELAPASAALLAQLIAEAFDESEVTVVTGGPEVGAAFARLRFDHLLFTGSARIGRKVASAAAENLVPVTLELGGKCPVIVGRSAKTSFTAGRIAVDKTMNAGQICMAPDYLLVPRERRDQLVEAIAERWHQMYPSLADNPDYGAIITEAHQRRLEALVEDARTRGARVIEVNPAGEELRGRAPAKVPPTLILAPNDEMAVMQEEIFGPVLPVLTYDELGEAIDYVEDHPRPLALYWYGRDQAEAERVLSSTTSGGAALNGAMMQFNTPDLPFGGVGASGFGAYRGVHGFRALSHARGVCAMRQLEVPNPAEPPYGTAMALLGRLWRYQ